MLRNRRMKQLLVLFMALSLVLAPALTATAAQGPAPQKILDNELVVSNFGDDGNIAEMQVLNHLRVFGNGTYNIDDNSQYKLASVRNLYGSEKITIKDNRLGIKVSPKGEQAFDDLYYLATLDQGEIAKINIPVSVKLEYYLDGKKVKPSEMSGKTGHIKIVCYLENTTGQTKELEFTDSKGQTIKKEAEVFTPFVVSLSGWEFANAKFSNIKAPGIAGESPQGVLANVQGITQVSWTVPLVPPKYPAKQYTVLEADGKDIELPSFKIAVIPIVPTTSEIDSLGTVQSSLNQLYNGFDAIQKGVGNSAQDATLLFGLNKVEGGVKQISDALGSLSELLLKIRVGLMTPGFDSASYTTAKGSDSAGKTPGVKDAVGLMKKSVDGQLLPAMAFQKSALTTIQTAIGTTGDGAVEPTATTSIYNDINYLKAAVAGTPAQKVITDSIEPKLQAVGTNVGAFRDGGNMITPSGSMAFPASVSAVEMGSKLLSESLGKTDGGLTMMVLGLGALDASGKPMKAMANGKPASILYAMEYLQESIDGQLVPGIKQIQEGTGKIGSGAGDAKEAIANGLQTFESIPVIVSNLEENAAQTDTFLGKPEGAQGTVMYVFQTPEVSKQGNAMKYGLGVIAVALIVLIALGRPPKEMASAPVQA
ncbi:MAG: hypothetical protein ACOX6L_05850 [Syntrophomonadaceae bacterium]